MPKLDEVVTDIGPYRIMRKAEAPEYEITGPAAPNAPLAYTMVRMAPEMLAAINRAVQQHARKVEKTAVP